MVEHYYSAALARMLPTKRFVGFFYWTWQLLIWGGGGGMNP